MWMGCPVRRSACKDPWDCRGCNDLLAMLEYLEIPESAVRWLCADCTVLQGLTSDIPGWRGQGEYRACGLYHSGLCHETCEHTVDGVKRRKWSAVLQMCVKSKYFNRWYEEVLRDPRKATSEITTDH